MDGISQPRSEDDFVMLMGLAQSYVREAVFRSARLFVSTPDLIEAVLVTVSMITGEVLPEEEFVAIYHRIAEVMARAANDQKASEPVMDRISRITALTLPAKDDGNGKPRGIFD
jgi:hypothetical protein